MGVIRVTKYGEEFTVDNFFDYDYRQETSNPIMVNPVNKYVAESLNIEDVEIINYIENQSDAFIQTGYSSVKGDITKIIRDIMYFDNKQYRFDGDNFCFGIVKQNDTCCVKYQDEIKNTIHEKIKVTYNNFQKITFICNTKIEKGKTPYSEFIIGDESDRVNINNSIDYFTGNKLYFTDMLLFKNNEEHSNYKARLKTAQIYKNDILVRDYVAAKHKKDNKVGLFDKVENKFYTSPNGTEFIAG